MDLAYYKQNIVKQKLMPHMGTWCLTLIFITKLVSIKILNSSQRKLQPHSPIYIRTTDMVLQEKLAQPFRNFFVNHLNEEMLTILN